MGDLVYNRLIWVRTVQIVGIGVVPTPGNAKELAHPANRILLSMTIDYRIFCSSSHSLSVDRRKSRSSSFSIFRRSISYLYSAMLGSRTSPFLGRPLGFGGTPAASFRCFRLYRERNPRISLYVNPSFLPQEAFFFHCLLLLEQFNLTAFFGAMEGTRTPGLLIRRNPEAIFIHSEFYDDSQFLTFCRYFRNSLPLYSLHCLHLCASIFQFSDVQKMCKNVQRLLMLEKIGIQLFLRASNSMHLSPRTVSFSS